MAMLTISSCSVKQKNKTSNSSEDILAKANSDDLETVVNIIDTTIINRETTLNSIRMHEEEDFSDEEDVDNDVLLKDTIKVGEILILKFNHLGYPSLRYPNILTSVSYNNKQKEDVPDFGNDKDTIKFTTNDKTIEVSYISTYNYFDKSLKDCKSEYSRNCEKVITEIKDRYSYFILKQINDGSYMAQYVYSFFITNTLYEFSMKYPAAKAQEMHPVVHKIR